MIGIVISIVWLIASVVAIYITDRDYHWDGLFKIFIGAAAIAFLFNGWQLYDPNMNHMIATIELNPTWTAALALSFGEAICITGPIAAIHSYLQYKKYK